MELSRAFTSILPVLQETPELIGEIMIYIEKHLKDKITLAQTSRRFLVSKSTALPLRVGQILMKCIQLLTLTFQGVSSAYHFI